MVAMNNSHLSIVLLSLILLVNFCNSIVQDSRHPEEWFEELERQWINEGHLPELSEDEILARRSKKRRAAEVEKMVEYLKDPRLRKKDLKDIANKVDKIGRPVLMHASLTPKYIEANKDDDKDDLTWDQKADKCDKWLVRNKLIDTLCAFDVNLINHLDFPNKTTIFACTGKNLFQSSRNFMFPQRCW